MTTIATRNGTSSAHIDPWQAAKAFKASGMFPDLKSEAEAYVKVLAGQELGIGPMASMMGINIIKGKVSFSSNLLAAQVKNHPHYDYKLTGNDGILCCLEFYEDGELLGESSYSQEDAKKAGVANQMYSKYPKAMLFARALTQGVRWYCPDVTAGTPAYVPEELGAEVDGEGEPVKEPVSLGEQQVLPPPADDPAIKLKGLIDRFEIPEDSVNEIRAWASDRGKLDLVKVQKAIDILEGEDVPKLLRLVGAE